MGSAFSTLLPTHHWGVNLEFMLRLGRELDVCVFLLERERKGERDHEVMV